MPAFWLHHLRLLLPGATVVPHVTVDTVSNPKMVYGAKHRDPASLKAFLQLIVVARRMSLPPSSPEYLRMFAHIYLSDIKLGPDSRQTLPVDVSSMRLQREHDNFFVRMDFPIGSKRVIAFYGQAGHQSCAELDLVNRRHKDGRCQLHVQPNLQPSGGKDFNVHGQVLCFLTPRFPRRCACFTRSVFLCGFFRCSEPNSPP